MPMPSSKIFQWYAQHAPRSSAQSDDDYYCYYCYYYCYYCEGVNLRV